MTNASILRILAHATPTATSRSKGQKSKSRGGGILWRPPSRTACCSSDIDFGSKLIYDLWLPLGMIMSAAVADLLWKIHDYSYNRFTYS